RKRYSHVEVASCSRGWWHWWARRGDLRSTRGKARRRLRTGREPRRAGAEPEPWRIPLQPGSARALSWRPGGGRATPTWCCGTRRDAKVLRSARFTVWPLPYLAHALLFTAPHAAPRLAR